MGVSREPQKDRVDQMPVAPYPKIVQVHCEVSTVYQHFSKVQ
jgi:hypothetical protein